MKRYFLAFCILSIFISNRIIAQSVTWAGSNTVTLKGDRGMQSFYLPFKIAEEKLRTLQTLSDTAFSISIGGRLEAGIAKRVTIKKDSKFALFLVTVDLAAFKDPADYEVIFFYSMPGIPPLSGSMVFHILRPSPILSDDTPLILEKLGPDTIYKELYVTETSGLEAAKNLKANVFGLNEKFLNLIQLKTTSIPAGSGISLKYSVNPQLIADVPLGTTNGTIQITGEAMAKPIRIPLQITRHRPSWLIIVVVFLGLGCGYLVRHVLQEKKDIALTRYSAYQLLAAMVAFREKLKDQTSLNRLDGDISKVQDALTDIQNELVIDMDPINTAINTVALDFETLKSQVVTTNGGTLQFTMERKIKDEKKPIKVKNYLQAAKWTFITANLTQWLVLTLLIGLGMYNGYKDNFVGRYSDMIPMFLFAFSIDVTVGSLTQFRGKIG